MYTPHAMGTPGTVIMQRIQFVVHGFRPSNTFNIALHKFDIAGISSKFDIARTSCEFHISYNSNIFIIARTSSKFDNFRTSGKFRIFRTLSKFDIFRTFKLPAWRLFTQPFIQTQIKENIKARRHWPLCGEFTGTGEFPAQMASNAENVSIWWRHH